MEKTLHDYFYIQTGEKLHLYSAIDSVFLMEAANIHIDRGHGIYEPDIQFKLNALIYECMTSYYEHGLTDDLLNRLGTLIRNVRIQCLVENKDNKLIAVHVAHIPMNPRPDVFGAYMFSHIASLGGLEGLKRCCNQNCLKFFIGRSNAKWCSKSCGSKFRVEKMRRNKKAG